MNVAYWIVAAVLALFYLYAGGIKVVRSKDQLRPMMGWVDSVPLRLVRTIGVLEVLGALGLVLPPLTGIAPGLALAAATGLGLIQVGAISLHLSRGEAGVIWLNVVLLALIGGAIWLSTIWL
ncbi:MAG TPA: DoxX family protein [Streptosporangiaceae bacterium]|nr:DoxX family protein [Streptosporangiaceae bacterium]